MMPRGNGLFVICGIAVVAMAACVALAQGEPERTRPRASVARFGSGPLNGSVQNETDAAIDRAVSWLVAKQSPHGCWGTTNVKATAVCAIAVCGDRSEYTEAETNCLHKALTWLREQKVTNAWSSAAMSLLDGKFDGDMSAIFAEYAQCLDTNDVAAAFVTDIARGERKIDRQKLALEWGMGLASKWYDDPERAWWLARSINIGLGGELPLATRNGDVVQNLNWRGAFARKWLLSQRIDTSGNGHWGMSPEKTAFAILLLSEL